MPPHPSLSAVLPDHPADDGDRAAALDQAFQRYAAFFVGLTPAALSGLRELCLAEVRFRDPFNDVTGVERMIAIFAQGFADTAEMRFEVVDLARRGRRGFILWRMQLRPKRLGGRAPWLVDGVSEIHFTADGKVAAHLDHWDAASQFYERIPLLGALIRLVKRRLQH